MKWLTWLLCVEIWFVGVPNNILTFSFFLNLFIMLQVFNSFFVFCCCFFFEYAKKKLFVNYSLSQLFIRLKTTEQKLQQARVTVDGTKYNSHDSGSHFMTSTLMYRKWKKSLYISLYMSWTHKYKHAYSHYTGISFCFYFLFVCLLVCFLRGMMMKLSVPVRYFVFLDRFKVISKF